MPKTSSKRPFPAMQRIRQRTSSHCGPAVLQMLLSYLDIRIDQDAFVNATGVTKKIKTHGMTVEELGLAISRVVPQTQFWYKRKATLQEVAVILREYNFPVGIEWQGIFGRLADDDDGHYGIITAINFQKHTVKIADPYAKFAGKDRIIPFAKFEPRWWDLNEVKTKTGKMRHVRDEQMLFVITPKTFKFPKALGLKKK